MGSIHGFPVRPLHLILGVRLGELIEQERRDHEGQKKDEAGDKWHPEIGLPVFRMFDSRPT